MKMLDRRTLTRGTLVKRYKRFLADVVLDSGDTITAHCPNTGSMKNCAPEGATVWLSHSDNPKRKYAFTWELVKTGQGHMIGINTGRANHLVREAILAERIPELVGYGSTRPEVKYGDSRVDLLLENEGEQCFVEVKSVTLLEEPASRGNGRFPDAVSERATKHVGELLKVHKTGARAVLLFCVQHSGIKRVQPAWHIDPTYAAALQQAAAEGLEVLAYKVRFEATFPRLVKRVPVELGMPEDS